MSLKRYVAIKDNTITNAFTSNLVTRGTGSNMGLADSMAVFSIFGQASSSSLEASRFLIQFPVSSSDPGTTILADRLAGIIPASGSVDFYLRVFNVVTGQTLPRDFILVVQPISQSWEEGYGLDMEEYKDKTYNGTGSNWINARAHVPWTAEGGDYLTTPSYKQTFDLGTEDLEINISELVENWITGLDSGKFNNFGVGVHLTSSQENGNRSYFTKHFSARGSEYFFSRPIIEARWDSTRKDQRGIFYVSSSTLSAADNLNTIYFYNYFRGQLTDLPNVGTSEIFVDVYSKLVDGTQQTTTPDQPVTGGWVSTGIYSASFALSTTEEVVFDRWFSGSIVYHTGTFMPINFDSSNVYNTPDYIASITNLRPEYCNDDITRLRVYTRLKNWNPTIYTVATAGIENHIIDNAYYKVFRIIDDLDVIPYGTGSENHTRLSYDASGSYFDLDMTMLEVGFDYGINFSFFLDGVYSEYNTVFKFKVIE